LLTFLITWASTAWMAMTFGANVCEATIISLVAALLKLEWDRRVAVAANLWVTCGRMVLAIPISIALAITPAMTVFGDYAEGVSKQGERTTITDRYERDLRERERLMVEVDSLRGGQNIFRTLAKVEENGLTQEEAGLSDKMLQRYGVKEPPSGKEGCGDRCEIYQQRAQGYESALEAKKQELSALPPREELRDRRETALTKLEQENTDMVTRLNDFYESASERPFTFWVFLGFIAFYGIIDLLPVWERLFSADLYTKEQLARIKEEERKLKIDRAKRRGLQRKKRAASWIEAKYYERVLEIIDSGGISLERHMELADKLNEFRAREDSSSVERESSGEEQWSMDGAEGTSRSENMSGEYPDPRPGASAGDGAPSPEEESDGPDVPRVNGRLLLPPANGQEGS